MTSAATVPPSGARLPLSVLAPSCAAAGLAASAAFAPVGAWPSAFLAVAVLAWAVSRTPRTRGAVLLGWVFGLTFMASSLVWQTSIMAASYAGLTLVTSLTYAALGGLLHAVRTLRWWPLWGAATWSVAEFVASVWPFDGFGWMRLGYAMVDSPLAGFYPFAGAAFVTFLVALAGHLLAWVADRPGRRRAAVAAVSVAGLLALGGLGTLWEAPTTSFGTVRVGWVQGGAPGGGVYGLGPARTITTNQARETDRLMDEVDAGRLPRPDLIVWPENATDLDPRSDAVTRALVEGAVARAGVGVLVGSIYEDIARDERQTVSLWWTADGVQDLYAKRNLVPFGEWIPFRDVLLPLIPPLAYVGAQSVPGVGPGVLDVAASGSEDVPVGVAICYEVIYPETLYEAVRAGARLMVVQSSNAMYQGTNQIDQQFAITRVRAAEMRTDVLVVTTSGLSGRIGTHGQVLWTAPVHDAASGVETMPLASATTPAMLMSRWVEAGLVLAGLAAAAVGWLRRRGFVRGGTMDAAARVGAPTQ